MDLIRIAVVEDNATEREHLLTCLKSYEAEHDESFQITTFEDGLDFVDKYSGIYQIIFLDIQMKWMDGMETAKRIREKDSDVVIIFVTNLAQHATEGYDVEAKAFLIKPVSYHVLSRQMDRLCAAMEKRDSGYLLLSNSREMQRISLGSIHYIESVGHFTDIHTSRGVIRVHSPLKSVEEKLNPARFARCNSGTIVNLEHLESIAGHEALVCGERLTISHSRKKPLMDALADYLGGRQRW